MAWIHESYEPGARAVVWPRDRIPFRGTIIDGPRKRGWRPFYRILRDDTGTSYWYSTFSISLTVRNDRKLPT